MLIPYKEWNGRKCVDCFYCSADSYRKRAMLPPGPYCLRTLVALVNPVSGEVNYPTCAEQRSAPQLGDVCGVNGEFFFPK
jgi:hypothetical protein